MQTNPAVEENKNTKWPDSPWNQFSRKSSKEEMICRRAKS